MLEVKDLSASYGKHRALHGVGLTVRPGEIVVILGANGAGKSTLLKAIAGICEGRVTGQVTMQGEPVLGLPAHRVVERGIALVPEGRGIFGELTVAENLRLGANPDRARDEAEAARERLVRLFPKLADRAHQVVRTMSGGEQQMVAIGRAMMSNPVILMLDEPSLGLSPLLSKELFQNLKAVRAAGLGILLVEQNARLSLAIADRGYLLENGQILREAPAAQLRSDPAVQAAYLGGAAGHAAAPAALVHAQEVPPPVVIRQAPPRSVPAGDLVGLDLGKLVARAAELGRPATPLPHPLPTGGRGGALSAPARSERLAAALNEIERAARAARERRPSAGLPPLRDLSAPPHSPMPPPQAAPAPDTPAPLPGGRVEVWHRRPGTNQFDRRET